MQKVIKGLAIATLAMWGTALATVLLSIPFQNVIARAMGCPAHLLGEFPILPLPTIMYCFIGTSCAMLIVVCSGSKKSSIWLELLVLVCLMVILPAVDTLLFFEQQENFAKTGILEYSRAGNIVSNIAGFCATPASWGLAFAYVTCGMSIAHKKMNKIFNQITNK